MPIYEYKCENGHVFDIMQRMSEDPRLLQRLLRQEWLLRQEREDHQSGGQEVGLAATRWRRGDRPTARAQRAGRRAGSRSPSPSSSSSPPSPSPRGLSPTPPGGATSPTAPLPSSSPFLAPKPPSPGCFGGATPSTTNPANKADLRRLSSGNWRENTCKCHLNLYFSLI